MLIGTSCRFSLRLRAVTTTSSRVASVDAPAAITGMACIPTGADNAAAMATASFERDGGRMTRVFRRDDLTAAGARLLRIASPLFISQFLCGTLVRVLYSDHVLRRCSLSNA